ncbi:FecR family protein [Novosphingobium lindaniclasticum]
MDPEEALEAEALAETARGWVARLASGEMDSAELDRFKQWRAAHPDHNRAFEHQRALWRALGRASAPAPGGPQRPRRLPWSRREQARVPRRAWPRIAFAGVAALAAVLAFPELILSLQADHRSGIAVESLTLPDGSAAVLDADSAIAVRFSDNERRVSVLKGDVWFDVRHGDARPFRVEALGGVTQDVGTAFEVRRERDSVFVSVTQGEVAVRSGTPASPLFLQAAQRARYERGGPALRLGDAATGDIAVWRNGELLLDRVAVSDAIAAIGRYRRGPVLVIGSVEKAARISAAFRTDKPEEAIDAIAQMSGFDVYRLAGIAVLRPAR